MTPYYCVYHSESREFAWIHVDSHKRLFHGPWGSSIENALKASESDNELQSFELSNSRTTPEQHIADTNSAADFLVCYYASIISTQDFYKTYPEFLI